MLSDREAEEIERGRRQKVVGPVVFKWIDQLLADRRERIERLAHLRRRLRQAFGYLEGLMGDGHAPPYAARDRPVCPVCKKPYVKAAGVSPQGIVYSHSDQSECRA